MMAKQDNVAFALCADGNQYEAYKDNLLNGLKKYLPGIDVVQINPNTISDLLSGVPEEQLPTMSRLAIPLMKEFDKYDRVIWIDVDVDIISSKFANILKVDTSKDGLAAVADLRQEFFAGYMKSRFPDYDHPIYFNAGLLVMDLYKIDRGIWKNKIAKSLEEHKNQPLRWKDQDILNANFEIKEIDTRFNYLWVRGVDPIHGAYLIHYVGKRGNDMLDEILALRSNGETASQGRYVVISPRRDFVRPWIRAYFASGNTIPLLIVHSPYNNWKADDFRYCKAAAEHSGGLIFDISSEFDNVDTRRNFKSRIFHSVAKDIHPRSWVWVDDDVEITGLLNECFDYAESAPGFVCSQFYYPGMIPDSIDSRHHAFLDINGRSDRLCWMSLLFFHGEANNRLAAIDTSDISDHDVFRRLYQKDPIWHDGFYDFSIREWQTHCKTSEDIPQHWGGRAIHYSGSGNAKIAWADKVDSLPLAPFEEKQEENPMENEESGDGPIDAVFVIGNGSINGNEELRYALRNLEKHCKFVRDVYICGVCPSWVDKTIVKHLQWPDRFNHAKDANIIDKLRHACEVRGIAKRILFCSDDQFQTRECSWEDFRPRYLRRYLSNDTWYEQKHRIWHTRLRNTMERDVKRRQSLGLDANEVFYYQPHIWMPIDRDKFIDYAKWSNYERRDDTIIASGYFNFINADGFPDQDNPVTFLDGGNRDIPSTVHVAYHDGSYNVAMSMLKKMFPDRCRFELPAKKNIIIGSVNSNARTMGQAEAVYSDTSSAPATKDEIDRIINVMRRIRQNPAWHGMLHEVAKAEELRLFGVMGWRIVWRDIIERWRRDTNSGCDAVPVKTSKSDDAAAILKKYSDNPLSMRTISFNQSDNRNRQLSRQLPRPDPDKIILRNRIHSALQRLSK